MVYMDFSVELLRLLNVVIFVVDLAWFMVYASNGWSRLSPYRRQISVGVIMMLFAGALGSAESFRRDQEITYVTWFVLVTGIVVLHALWIGRKTPIESQ